MKAPGHLACVRMCAEGPGVKLILLPNRTVLATLVTSAFGSGFSECALSASA